MREPLFDHLTASEQEAAIARLEAVVNALFPENKANKKGRKTKVSFSLLKEVNENGEFTT